MYCVEEDIIELDVGGTHQITTSKNTLLKFEGSTLAAMFSGRHNLPKHKGRIFIDRDGHAFNQVVNYLRSGQKPIFNDFGPQVHFQGRVVS